MTFVEAKAFGIPKKWQTRQGRICRGCYSYRDFEKEEWRWRKTYYKAGKVTAVPFQRCRKCEKGYWQKYVKKKNRGLLEKTEEKNEQ